MDVVANNPNCTLHHPDLHQCCCNCVHLRPVHYHCTTEPRPTKKEMAKQGVTGRCVCAVQKGWACCSPELEAIHDNWGQHSCGCECYTPILYGPPAPRAMLEEWQIRESLDGYIAIQKSRLITAVAVTQGGGIRI
jgi:hypothetical protein